MSSAATTLRELWADPAHRDRVWPAMLVASSLQDDEKAAAIRAPGSSAIGDWRAAFRLRIEPGRGADRPPGAAAGRKVGPGEDAPSDQHHVRRRRIIRVERPLFQPLVHAVVDQHVVHCQRSELDVTAGQHGLFVGRGSWGVTHGRLGMFVGGLRKQGDGFRDLFDNLGNDRTYFSILANVIFTY